MRIITKCGTDIPYEAMGVAVVSVYLETVEDVKKRKGITHDASDDVFFTCLRERKKEHRVCAGSMYYYAPMKKPVIVAKYDTLEEARQTILQIAILAAKGTKLIRMTENGEIEVVV